MDMYLLSNEFPPCLILAHKTHKMVKRRQKFAASNIRIGIAKIILEVKEGAQEEESSSEGDFSKALPISRLELRKSDNDQQSMDKTLIVYSLNG